MEELSKEERDKRLKKCGDCDFQLDDGTCEAKQKPGECPGIAYYD